MLKPLLLLALYFLPTLAAPRGQRFEVFFTNLLLGWTVIGWVWALNMANEACIRRAAWRRGDC